MVTYSHSRVSCFETCPYQYKLKYIDKIEIDIPAVIESFMGDIVHKALEKLYKDRKFQKQFSKSDLLNFYKDTWEREYSDDILIVKKGLKAENYKKMGEQFLSDYYDRMKPFEQMTILGLETQDKLTLPNGNQWHIRIDKLGCDDKGNYYVCDYKTSSRIKAQKEADEDRQLAMYSIWVKDKFRDAKSVKLVWHMLAFNKDAISERTDEQLKKLQEDIMQSIQKIQEAEEKNNFPTNVTKLCDYCLYKSLCPSFKHLEEIENLPKKEFKEEEGVRFVDEFSEIKNKLEELEKKQKELKNNLVEFSKQKGVNVVYGSNMKCSIREFDRIVIPGGEDKLKFINLMKDRGIYEECSMICYPKINSRVLKGKIDEDIRNKCGVMKDYRLNLSKKEEEGEE
jgi:putative RecB family exonuclease